MRRLPALLLPGALVLAANASAQEPVTGTVFDAYTSARIGNVTITDSSSQATVQTDRDGQFSLPCTGATTLVFRKIGYQATQRTVETCGSAVRVGLIPGAQSLATMNVVGSTEQPVIEKPQSITMLSPRELHRSSGLFLDQAVNLTPGIRMQRRTMAGGITVSIRGYGNGTDASNFTGLGFKAYLNGIPITDAEGQTIMDDIDVANLGRMEIVRGPASSLYGAGIGGVLNMYTAQPHQLGLHISQQMTGGSDGLFRSDTRLSSVSNGATTLISYGHQGYDGYRVHSESKKDYGTFFGEFRPSDRRTITTYVGYANSDDQRAGELDSASFFQRLNIGEDKYAQNGAHLGLESLRAGVTHRYRFNDHVQNTTTAYYTGSTISDISGAGLTSTSDQNFGARAVFNTTFGSVLPLSGTTGGEFQKTNNVVGSYSLDKGAVSGMRSSLETQTMQYSLFTQWDLGLPADVTLTAGASVNFIEYLISDRLASTNNPTHLDASGRKVFDPVVTPRVALRKMFGKNISAYADVSQGYSPPTSKDAVIAYTGEANTGLEPERATQYEVGTKGSLLGSRLSYQVALFDLRVKHKLTSEAVFDTDGTVLYSYTVNGGNQNDRGLELSSAYALINDPTRVVSMVRPFVSYTYSDFTYDHFASDANDDAGTVDYTGKHVVGVAPNTVSMGVDARLRSGLYLNATYHHMDKLPLTYDNVHHAPGYQLLEAKVGFVHDVPGGFNLDAYVGGNNLTKSLYYTQVFLNHKWDTQAQPHAYLPGPYTATYYGGVKVTYSP